MKKYLTLDIIIKTVVITIFILALIGGYVAYNVNQ